ncbi:MAG TPA: hypothetical protein VGX25_24345 [Actinophytocola sp.]|uniref:hypothetical protein n=1 Tax=Actinophytocola sp. TaxID=1872138 RepID=UPI002DDD6712|nr:hypothetical protein [Actinophytocola sp.]HEV2782536.1 hypothetical protein [Actinophytocola sp.]
MAHQSITQEELTDLCDKLRELDLTEAQRALLDAILRIAFDATVPEESLDDEFDGCFEPDQAAVILAYQDASITSSAMITRSWPTGIGKAPAAGISRGISRGSHP